MKSKLLSSIIITIACASLSASEDKSDRRQYNQRQYYHRKYNQKQYNPRQTNNNQPISNPIIPNPQELTLPRFQLLGHEIMRDISWMIKLAFVKIITLQIHTIVSAFIKDIYEARNAIKVNDLELALLREEIQKDPDNKELQNKIKSLRISKAENQKKDEKISNDLGNYVHNLLNVDSNSRKES